MILPSQLISINVPIFANYETTKITIDNPLIVNLIFLAIFLLAALISIQKQESHFLDHSQTTQLKGLAILLVVVGHFWVHVSNKPAIPVLGDYSVSLFLLLSGFGLTMSSKKRKTSFIDFFSHRLRKVIFPYWIITIIIIAMDFYLLNKTYSLKTILFTLIGINFDLSSRHLDYVRWFITLLLFYYLAFYITERYFSNIVANILLFFISFLLVALRLVRILPFGEINQLVAFPIGSFLALHLNFFSQFVKDRYLRLIIGGTVLIILLSFTILLTDNNHNLLSKIINFLARNSLGIVFCLFSIICVRIIGTFSYLSKFLIFCGTISYELYLIHGPLLIKYNPILNFFPGNLIIFGFVIFLTGVLTLSYSYNKSLRLLDKILI